jgi:uncharacterized protein YndB with AHSA1/START domain
MKKHRIEKHLELKAPVSRVWRALTNHHEFGRWFRVKLAGPFKVGKICRGRITWPGFEHIMMEVLVEKIEPEHYFAYGWHPYAIDPDVDYSKEPRTLVEFTLAATKTGTRLTVVESGFEKIPADRRAEAFRMDNSGWSEQLQNIKKYVAKK